MFTTEAKRGLVKTTLGWMKDIHDRNSAIAWPLTSEHRQFIEFVEGADETLTFDEWKKQSKTLMHFHAMARNDIYDFSVWSIGLDKEGRLIGHDESVPREEKDVRVLLRTFRKHYPHNHMTCKTCQGHMPQYCEWRKE